MSIKGSRAVKAFGRWQIGRGRAVYWRYGVPRSDVGGLEGWLVELAWGLANLSDDVRHEADDRVLRGLFLGRAGMALLRASYRVAPGLTERAFAAASPIALGYLTGPMEHVAPTTNFVPCCEFRGKGGDELCERVCRAPSERFCGEHLVPVRLRPSPTDLSCRWSWGGDGAHEP